MWMVWKRGVDGLEGDSSEVGDHCEGVAAFVSQPNRTRPSPIICRGVDLEPIFLAYQCHQDVATNFYHLLFTPYATCASPYRTQKVGTIMIVALRFRQPLVASRPQLVHYPFVDFPF